MKMDEMEKAGERKQERKDSIKLKLLISILSFLIVFVAEVYVIINAPGDIQTILLATVMLLLAAYFVVDSVIALSEQRTEKLAEQYEDIYNTQKATYVILNNSFEEMSEKITFIEKILKISTDEIINAQKGTSKVIINRNKENTEAVLQSYIELSGKMEEIGEAQREKLSGLDVLSEKMVADVNKQIEWKMQQLAIQMKDMELHLNQSIMQNLKVVVSQAIPISVPENMNVNPVKNVGNAEKEYNDAKIFQTTESVRESYMPIEKVTEEVKAEEYIQAMNEAEFVQDKKDTNDVNCEHVEEKNEIESKNSMEGIDDIPEVENFEDEFVFSEIEKLADVTSDVEVVEESGKNDIEELDIEVAPELRLEEPMLEIIEEQKQELMIEEPLMDDSVPEDITVTEVSLEGVGEEKPAMPDMSNPNKIMTPEEIAALIANTESIPEEPTVEEAEEEKPVAPDLSDPNKMMTPDEIAALISSVEDTQEEPKVEEEKPPMPDLSDPNKVMTPDEIAALIANL